MHSQPHPDAGPAMKLHQMRYLVAVAGCGSVRAASRALGITQSAITQALRELEEGHRLALFERQSSGIVLTPAGRTLLRHAQLITGQMAQAEDEMARLRDTCAVARLSVGVTPWVGQSLLPHVLRAFRAELPQVDRKSTRLNSSHLVISYAVFCLIKQHILVVAGRVHLAGRHWSCAAPDQPGACLFQSRHQCPQVLFVKSDRHPPRLQVVQSPVEM